MDSAQEVKNNLDIVDIIGEYLPLKPAGSGSFRTNCPFHQEKTPSFFVNRPRQTWHCFGCNLGGDMISFVEKIEGMEFLEALELLAQKAGIQLPKFDKQQMTEKKSLQEANEYICKLLQHNLLTSDEAKIAREYIKQRGIDDITADEWRLGYAPSDWNNLENKIKEQGITANDLIKIGIANLKENNRGIYYRFRSRLMFPISDAFGHIIGFTGRILTDEKVAKYINTPETILYKKSHVLYGLDKAKAEIKRKDLAIIVEGNMDALTAHQFDCKNVIASSGTALTAEQLKLIKRFTNNIAMAFDTDAAGVEATLRGMDLARLNEFNIRIIKYDESIAKDPDELIRKDINHWNESISKAKPVMEWIYARAFEQFSDSTPEGKKNIAGNILNELRHMPNPVELDAWLSRLAKDLNVSVDALRSAMKGIKPSGDQKPAYPSKDKVKIDNIDLNPAKSRRFLESAWLAAVITNQGLFHEINLNWNYPEHEKLYSLLKNGYNSSVLLNKPDLDQEIQNLLDYLVIFADKEFPDLSKLSAEIISIENRLLANDSQKTKADLEAQMRDAERTGDEERIKQILQQFQNLNN
ncbi:MAG: DNA primase [Patescibacteria group bacterium]